MTLAPCLSTCGSCCASTHLQLYGGDVQPGMPVLPRPEAVQLPAGFQYVTPTAGTPSQVILVRGVMLHAFSRHHCLGCLLPLPGHDAHAAAPQTRTLLTKALRPG